MKKSTNHHNLFEFILNEDLENCKNNITPKNVNAIDSNSRTLLHYATNSQNTDIAALLINNRANVNAPDNANRTPLHYAINYSNSNIAELLINNGADLNASDNAGLRPLHYAINFENTAIAGLIMTHGADLNARDNDGRTPIYYAIYSDNFLMIMSLLNNQASLDVQNNNHDTPLAYAMNINQPIAFLIAIYQRESAVVAELLNNGISFDYDGNTPLHIATSLNANELIAIILNNAINVDVNSPNSYGRTPTGIAIENDNYHALNLINYHISNALANNNMLDFEVETVTTNNHTTPDEAQWVDLLISANFELLFSIDSFY
jgi:ankyrin repeat protein